MNRSMLVIKRTYVPDQKRAAQALVTLLTAKRKPADVASPAGEIHESSSLHVSAESESDCIRPDTRRQVADGSDGEPWP
jgi:hypothetical protein